MIEKYSNHSRFFKNFIESFRIINRETAEDYDIHSLLALYGEEKEEAIELLIKQLNETGDPRAPRALGYMECKEAVPELRKALESKEGRQLVEIANALFRIAGDSSVASYLIRVLCEGDTYARIFAASSLCDYKTLEVDGALKRALYDEDKLVRANALRSLLTIHDMLGWDLSASNGLGKYSFRLGIKYKAVRNRAVEELKKIIKLKDAGSSAEELGFSLEYVELSSLQKKLASSYRAFPGKAPWEEDYDLETLELLKGDEAIWGESALLHRLQIDDFRAVRALVHIKSELAIEVFNECIINAEGRMLVELVWALWELTGNRSFKLRLLPCLESSDERLKERAQEVFELLS